MGMCQAIHEGQHTGLKQAPARDGFTRDECARCHRPRVRSSCEGLTVREALAELERDRIHEIRRQIEEGTYITEDKLDIVADRLANLLTRVTEENERRTA